MRASRQVNKMAKKKQNKYMKLMMHHYDGLYKL